MNDIDFLNQFETKVLDEKLFDHQGHLRLAWLYLSKNELPVALSLVCTGIKNYAESLGATTKFHLTITDAIVRIMQQKMIEVETTHWQVFLEKNPELMDDLLSVLYKHFSPELLATEKARTTLVKPDRNPL